MAADTCDPLPRRRPLWRRLLPALLLPALFAIATWLPLFAMASLDGDHHAQVWVDGTPEVLALASKRAADDAHFNGGLATYAVSERPQSCASGAVALFFEVRRDDLAQATRLALEEVATGAGARVCASQRFILNVPVQPQHTPGRWLLRELWQVFVLLAVPAGLVLLAYAAPFGAPARRRWRSEQPALWQRPLVIAALAAILLAAGAAWASSGIVPALQRTHVSGLSPAFALHELVLLPLLHQLAFRTWVFAQLRPRLPAGTVAVLAVVVQLIAANPHDFASALSSLTIAGACTGLYLWRGGWLGPVLLHALAIALIDARLIAG